MLHKVRKDGEYSLEHCDWFSKLRPEGLPSMGDAVRVRKGSIFEIIATILFFACACIGAQGATIHVPADYSTIQAAINAASNGDTIVVAPGTYQENINFQGKAITLFRLIHFSLT